jgi:uncharacterized protein (TIGR03643 family)
MKSLDALTPAAVSDIIEMALSDHIAFKTICDQYAITPDQIKALMRREIKPASYRAWRKRVREFSDRRTTYK